MEAESEQRQILEAGSRLSERIAQDDCGGSSQNMSLHNLVDSAYSSIESNQNKPPAGAAAALVQSSPQRLQLQSLAEAAQERAVEALAITDAITAATTTPTSSSPTNPISIIARGGLDGAGGGKILGDIGVGTGGAMSVERHLAPPNIPAHHPAHHPAHTPAPATQHSECENTTMDLDNKSASIDHVPITPKLQTASAPAATSASAVTPSSAVTMPSSSPLTPAVVAGSKRTSSGAVKSSLSVPNSPMERIAQPKSQTSVTIGVPASPGVDPSRIQELSAQLRTRLKYARIKVDNNWTTKSLDQVESIYHSNQNSPARPACLNREKSDVIGVEDPDGDGSAKFGPPLHTIAGNRRQGHSRTSSEPMNRHYPGGGPDGAKTYENFWKERAPFTTKMLEKMTGTGGGATYQNGPGDAYGHPTHHHHQQPGQYQQQQYQQHGSQYPPFRRDRSMEHAHYQQMPGQSSFSGQRTIRLPPPPLTPSHSNLSSYSATYDPPQPQPPRTPLRQSHSHSSLHPSLSRGNSNKSAEEEAVESLMFLMSSPGNNNTPRRENRVTQNYPHANGLGLPRRGSMLRENSDGWSSSGRFVPEDVDLDVTDAEDLSGAREDEENCEDETVVPLPPTVRGRTVVGNRRRSNSDLARYTHTKIRQLGQGVQNQDRVSKLGTGAGSGGSPGSGGGVTSGAKRKLGPSGVAGVVGNGERRRLASPFTPG